MFCYLYTIVCIQMSDTEDLEVKINTRMIIYYLYNKGLTPKKSMGQDDNINR